MIEFYLTYERLFLFTFCIRFAQSICIKIIYSLFLVFIFLDLGCLRAYINQAMYLMLALTKKPLTPP